MYGQIIPFTPKNYKKNENNEINSKEKKDQSESNEKKEKEKDEIKKEYSDPKLKEKEKEKDITIRQPLTTTTAIFIPPMPMANAIFLNQVQNNKNYYNKFQTKKRTCFAGRTGDWTSLLELYVIDANYQSRKAQKKKKSMMTIIIIIKRIISKIIKIAL